MSKVKEVAATSKEIIERLEKIISEVANIRASYTKYQSLLEEAKKMHQQKYNQLWNQVYNETETTNQEQDQLNELEEVMKGAWKKLAEATGDILSPIK